MLYILVFCVVLGLDFITKILAIKNLQPISTIPILKGIFHLTYVENKGAAFGMFQNARIFLVIAAVLCAIYIVYFLLKSKNKSKLLNMGLVFVLAGAVGNLLDRIFRGFVVDFLDFRLINFPVFNIADIFVCVGALFIMIFIIFFDEKTKEEPKNDKA